MRRDKLTWAAVGLAVGIIGGSIGTAAAKWWPEGTHKFDKIQAREIRIVDAAGNTVAMLVALDYGGALAIQNAEGQKVAMLSAVESGGALQIDTRNGAAAAILAATHKRRGLLGIYEAGEAIAVYP